MNEKLENLRESVSELAQDKDFIHHKWFFKYHLELVEQISLELSERYDANMDLMLGLVWIHDYAKTIGIKEDEEVIVKSKNFLLEQGFDNEYVDTLIHMLELFERKDPEEFEEAPIEVKIVSTADAVSHMYGPFYQIYCYENPEMSVEELMESNIRKLEKDWNRKIVLPEVKKELQVQYDFLRQSFGEIPEGILS
jgi:hypothetical protein